ncbi:PCDHD1 [Acanthosepion pharaonis]|uniref:PCDHD1 n=1 Tax=Acanthosepion pharaonis TaxID=158019 RepID=A0A812D6R0_ACAPH|nr:PCDHD1 [Sepia pharaonis]
MDVNDNVPYFVYPETDPYTFEIHYPPLLTPNNITVVQARDNDSRENAFLNYQIARGNDKQLFNINRYSGQLSFNPIVTKNDEGLYNLQIVVKDSGYPVQSAMTTLSLLLTVANETTQSLSAVQITSDIKVHKSLAVVTVLIAMTVSVIVVASVTLGVVRAKDRFQNAREEDSDDSGKCLSKQRRLMGFSQQTIPQFGCSTSKPEALDKIRDSRLLTFRQESDCFLKESENDEQRCDPALSTNRNQQVSSIFRIK